MEEPLPFHNVSSQDEEKNEDSRKYVSHVEDPRNNIEASATKSSSGSSEPGSGDEMEAVTRLLFERLHLKKEKQSKQVLESLDLEGIAAFVQSNKCKHVIVMAGAGLSTAAGIPDFRSPGSGLYSNLKKYNLPRPECIFDIGYFKHNPEPFFLLAKEMFPGKYKPTLSHYFIRLLQDKGLLLRCYTQNIDGLEREAGLPGDSLVEAHGTYFTSHCIECRSKYGKTWIHDRIFGSDSEGVPRCEKCDGIVKPDIVFFGENLPHRFFKLMHSDFRKCDLLIVIGTSLVVQPFASLVERVDKKVPRLLLNKEKVYQAKYCVLCPDGFDFDSDKKYRDVAQLGDCDDSCLELAELLGWKEELMKMFDEVDSKASL